MREIKFRAWDYVMKRMLYPFGGFDGFTFAPHGVEVFYQNAGGDPVWYQNLKRRGYDKLLPIMQYTGLKDKNGKEIYEGDIVNDGWVVEARPFCWLLRKGLHGAARPVTTFYEDAYEVIGNIYENKELLE